MSWPLIRLGEICTTTQGVQILKANTRNESYVGGCRYLYIADFVSNNKLSFVDDVFENKKVTINDLVMANTGSPGLVFKGKYGILSNNLFKISFDNKSIDCDYLYRILSSDAFQTILQKQMKGGIQKHLGHQTIAKQEIRLPPLEEQKRIAAILDKADAIRQKRQKAIELADEFLRSVFLDMFGDPVTNPKGWDTYPIEQISQVVTGNTPPRSEKDNYGSHIEWIKSDNINTPNHYLTKAEEYLSVKGLEKGRLVSEGAILITCIAGSPQCIGNVAITNRPVAFNQQINALIPSDMVTTQYIYSLVLFGKKLIQSISTNSMKGMVSKGNLEKLYIPVPPIELQNKYSSIFKTLEDRVNLLCSSREYSDDLFLSIQKSAFSGEL